MGSSIELCTVIREAGPDPETAVVRYRKRSDGWYVQTPKDAEFWKFAQPGATETTVVQLINKKWDERYGNPDSFGDETQQDDLSGFEDSGDESDD